MFFIKLIIDKINMKWLEVEVKILFIWILYNNELNCWIVLVFCWEYDLEIEKLVNEWCDLVFESNLK